MWSFPAGREPSIITSSQARFRDFRDAAVTAEPGLRLRHATVRPRLDRMERSGIDVRDSNGDARARGSVATHDHPTMTFTGFIGTVCMYPLRAIIAASVALGIHPNLL